MTSVDHDELTDHDLVSAADAVFLAYDEGEENG
jgi:hypothetical protein